MKARNYRQVLEARGYKAETVNEYQGTDVYKKVHLYNTVVCKVEKDSHGKAQDISFNIATKMPELVNHDMEDWSYKMKKALLDREFLVQELIKITDYFEQLRQMKSPKHLYCF